MFRRLLIALSLSAAAWTAAAQDEAPFNGLLLDGAGAPVRRARVYVVSPRRYAVTDRQGRFGLTGVLPDDTLKVEFRRATYRIPVEGRRSIIIRLADAGEEIRSEESEALVDVGYGYVSRREHTGASNGISGEELQRSGHSDLLSALQGRIPGLAVSDRGFGRGYGVTIRGQSSIMLDSTPLFIVDGVEVQSLEGISLYDVERVEVMKDASIYGSRGANGAILVRTKGPRRK